MRPATVSGDKSRFASQCGHDVDAAGIALGPEGDFAAVGREDRLTIIGWIASEADGFATTYLLNPNIEVALATAVGSIRQQLAVRRESVVSPESEVRRTRVDVFESGGGLIRLNHQAAPGSA